MYDLKFILAFVKSIKQSLLIFKFFYNIYNDCFKLCHNLLNLINPLFKSETLNNNELQNYRPVSYLSFLLKIIKTVILRQLTGHMECNQPFCEMLPAYQKNHSSKTVIVKVYNNILSKFDDNKNVVLILFDLSAAFDTINHGRLMQKLHLQYSITNTAPCWFNSYL